VTISGAAAQTSTLTVVTTAPTSGALVHPRTGGMPWYAAAGATLACVLFLGVPGRRRGSQMLLGMLILLVFVSTLVVGCGGGSAGSTGSGGTGGSGSGGGTPANPGTTAGTYTVTVTGTSGSIVKTVTVTLTVN
jgi:hypothetical protein